MYFLSFEEGTIHKLHHLMAWLLLDGLDLFIAFYIKLHKPTSTHESSCLLLNDSFAVITSSVLWVEPSGLKGKKIVPSLDFTSKLLLLVNDQGIFFILI